MLSDLTTNSNNRAIYEQCPDDALAIYIHIPFCRTRCTYCAFNTYVGQTALIPSYVRAIAHEIASVAPANRLRVTSIYFGGGTPSLLTPEHISTLLGACAVAFDLAPHAEITLEANPGTVDQAYLTDLRHAGVTRLSVGMQSAHPSELRLFGRTHTARDVQRTVSAARQANFETLNLDLIYGIPHQTNAMWRASLDVARDLNPDHLSLYSLSIEDATPLQRRIARGRMEQPDPDRAADMYEYATDYLAAAGYEQYEISNWAKAGHACRHNVHIWRNLPYLGFGAGAHGYAAHTRYANIAYPAAYVAQVMAARDLLPFPLSAAADDVIQLEQADVMAETVIMGLRLVQIGISEAEFRARFGHELCACYGVQIERLVSLGLLERAPNGRIHLSRRGRLLGNRVFAEFI